MINTNTRIVQYSPGRTGSTLLTNILYGLYNDGPVTYSEIVTADILQHSLIVKTHEKESIDAIIDKNQSYKLFFVCSERVEIHKKIDPKYKVYKNIIVFPYEEYLKETQYYTIATMIKNIEMVLRNFLPPEFSCIANIDQAINRINSMNTLYSEIREKPFLYYDTYYHIHGSHRNRNNIY